MFDISDQEIEGIESGGPVRSGGGSPRLGGMPIAGLGLDDEDPAPAPAVAPSPPQAPPVVAPPPADDRALRSGAGRALVAVTLGLVGGAIVGGPFGAAAGVVGVGAVRNLLRTKATWASPDPAVRAEAGKSATMAIFGLGVAGMLGYHAYKKKSEDS